MSILAALVVMTTLLDSVTLLLAPPELDLPRYNYNKCKGPPLDVVKRWEKWPNADVQLCAEPVPYDQ